MMKSLDKKKNTGFSLVEILFYISLLAMVTIVVVNSMIVMMRSFKEISIKVTISNSSNILERVTREVKQARDINAISSTSLTLATKDESNNDKTITFTLNDKSLEFYENGTLTGNINTPDISITNLSFTNITLAKGKAIKITMTVKSNRDQLNRTYDFYDTVLLRGNY